MFGIEVISKGDYVLIKGFPTKYFINDCIKYFNTSKFKNIMSVFGLFKTKIYIHNFFLPEFVFIMARFKRHLYKQIIHEIYEKTWLKASTIMHPSRINLTRISNLNVELKSYQKEFIDLYDDKKQKYMLKGYILAFEQGLGKSYTSLALMEGLAKDCVVIVAPKSTIKTVWQPEINKLFKTDKKVWTIGEKPVKAKYYIVNYESLDKLSTVLSYINKSKDVGIIVDECHNFKTAGAKRVRSLINVARATECQDILLMSGTPIKAMGSEMIPALQLIDSFFDDSVLEIFKKTFGLNAEHATEVLRNRLGLMMFRKTKDEVLKLPQKTRHEVKIKTPNGKKYTVPEVKKLIIDFINERKEYYKKNFDIFSKEFQECIDYLSKRMNDDEDFKKYLWIISILKKHGYQIAYRDDITWANKYEKEILRPMLPNELKKKFDRSKSVVKYLNLKIMGEVLGGLLTKLRSEMFSEMLQYSPTCNIISQAEKKTVCFTTFVDVANTADHYIRNFCKFEPLLITGQTSQNIKEMLSLFKQDPNANPIVATIQTMSTGVNLVEANTVIFINQPWRHTDRIQAEDRCHRIGQDTDVFIYNYVLDTGTEQNLSTRMEDIIAWSKDMFEGIIGDTVPEAALKKMVGKEMEDAVK